jgi:hypothetical protein
MTKTCSHCGANLQPGDQVCPACRQGIDSVSQGEKSVADTPTPLPPKPPVPQLPPVVVVVFATFICAWLSASSFGDGEFSFTAPSPGALMGAFLGLLVSVAICLDDKVVQRRIEERNEPVSPALEAMPQPGNISPPTDVIALVMLVIPLVAAVLVWQRDFFQLPPRIAPLLGLVTILSTAVLGYLDMRQLMLAAPVPPSSTGQPQPRPIFNFLTILGFWLVGYPVHFLARKRFGARNLIAPALLVTGAFVAPTISAWFAGPVLPSVHSREVIDLVQKVIEDSPMYQERKDEIGPISLHEPVEISFDQPKQRRVGRARLLSKLGDEPIFFTVEWQDQKKGMFMVQVYEKEP